MTSSADEENKQLRQRLQEYEKECSSLKKEIETLKSKQNDNNNGHSREFWDDIDRKLITDPDAIKQLIKNGTITMNDCGPNTSRRHNWRLLEHALDAGNYDIIQLCLNLGANVNDVTKKNLTFIPMGAYHCEQLILSNDKGINIGEKIENVISGVNQQNGIIENIMNELNDIGQQKKEIFEKVVIEMMINIIREKLIFSDDLLGLCWKIESNKGDPLQSELWNIIRNTCLGVIEGKNKRDWYWLKTYILPSKIWYNNTGSDEEKNETKGNEKSWLYYKLLNLVEDESNNKLDKLKEKIKEDASKNEKAFNRLTTWDVKKERLVELAGSSIPRQDAVPNGIISEYTKEQLNYTATTVKFNGSVFYDHYQYLSKLSLLAQTVDSDFQSSIQKVFNINKATNIGIIKNGEEEKNEDITIEYTQGPVKLLERARSKAQNDYFMESYPTSAMVLDFNRCALVFNDIQSLLFALDLFVNKVRAYQSGSIIGIVRCKNGFIEYVKEVQYADIKLNVLIRGRSNNIIGEVQFLLKTMKKYKTSQHNLYSISREEEFVTKIFPNL